MKKKCFFYFVFIFMLHHTHPAFCNDTDPQKPSFYQEFMTKSITALGIQAGFYTSQIACGVSPTSNIITSVILAIASGTIETASRCGVDMLDNYLLLGDDFNDEHPAIDNTDKILGMAVVTGLGMGAYSLDPIIAFESVMGGAIGVNMMKSCIAKAMDITESITGTEFGPSARNAAAMLSNLGGSILGSRAIAIVIALGSICSLEDLLC